MADEDYRTACSLRHGRHAFQNRTHLVGPVHIHAVPQVRLNGIQDDEPRSGPMHRLLQPVITERQLPPALVDDQHPCTVRSSGLQSRLNGIRQTVLCRLVDHAHGGPCLFTLRQNLAPGQRRHHCQHEGGLALAGVALDDGQLSQRDVGIPQPLYFLCLYILHGDQLQIVSHIIHLLPLAEPLPEKKQFPFDRFHDRITEEKLT